MSGIFGIINRNGQPVSVADLEFMRDAMAHRGPDGCEIWLDGEAGLGQLMLHSTPESLCETLPWKDPESGLVITADARIDNRDELLALVGGRHAAEGFPITDSQFILAAYKRWGEACVDHLLGDFAFAIWNPREKKLFCARDHMGIRPFYFHVTDKLFVFASSALGVVAAGEVPKKILEERVADYLAWELEGVDKTCTIFSDVWRMPPARIGCLTGQGFLQHEYWRPDTEFELKLGSDEEYTDAFEEKLTQAVQARLRCHKPVASMLSGGLDSSTIVGIARKIQQEDSGAPFATYSGVSEEGEECRESLFCRKVIDQGGLDATLLRPSGLPAFTERMRGVDHSLEDPFEAGWILHQMIYLSARENGQVVVMDGIGGESTTTLTSTYPTFLAKEGHWLTANREILGMWNKYHRRTIPLWWKYRDLFRSTLVPGFARKIKRRLLKRRLDWIDSEYLVSPEYAAEAGMKERLETYRKNKGLAHYATLRQAHGGSLGVSYLTAGTERYGRLAACCGVENRQPLQDRRLIDFCVSLPWNQLVRDGWSKFGMRRVAQRVLPHEVAWRTGWDEVMWKFWSAWNELNREDNQRELSVRPLRLKHMLNNKKFDERSNRYIIGGNAADESIVGYLNLLGWLNRIN